MVPEPRISFHFGERHIVLPSSPLITSEALYLAILRWLGSEEGIVANDFAEMASRNNNSRETLVLKDGWLLRTAGKAADDIAVVSGAVVAHKGRLVAQGYTGLVRFLPPDRGQGFVPTEAQIRHAAREALLFEKDWDFAIEPRALRRRDGASARRHSVLGLYWFAKQQWLLDAQLGNFDFPIRGDNLPPVPGTHRRWEWNSDWHISSDDLSYLVGGPMATATGDLLVPALEEDARPAAQPSRAAHLSKSEVRIGIVTVLEIEYLAMKSQLDDAAEHDDPLGRRYLLGSIPARNSGNHRVALTMAGEGNNRAAIRARDLLAEFPTIQELVMVGIAGAVPCPDKAEDHVRLGDVVTSGEGGVVQYDYVTEHPEYLRPRGHSHRPSARLLEIRSHLEVAQLEGRKPWMELVSRCPNSERPNSDILMNRGERVEHPTDLRRTPDEPRVFSGTIGAANILQKNPTARDIVRDFYDVKCIEMESSGIQDAAWSSNTPYFVVRGTCDYCDSYKSDEWQPYAAAIAAAYAAALLRETTVIGLVGKSGI